MIEVFVGLAVIALIGIAFALAPSTEVRTEARIDASPEKVWNVLTDGARYGEWNPFIVVMEGTPAPGARLRNRMRPEGGSEMTFSPTVLVAEPERELRWLGRLLVPRIFDGEHYFLLEETGDGDTRLVHGEKFRGILLWFMGTDRFAKDFERMNAALKAQAEAP